MVEPLSAATSEVKVYGQRKNQCKRKIFIALYLSCVPKKNRSAWNDCDLEVIWLMMNLAASLIAIIIVYCFTTNCSSNLLPFKLIPSQNCSHEFCKAACCLCFFPAMFFHKSFGAAIANKEERPFIDLSR